MTDLQNIKMFNEYSNHAKEDFFLTFEQWAINNNHPSDEYVNALSLKLSQVDKEFIAALPYHHQNNYTELKRLLLEKYKPEDSICLLSAKLSGMQHNLNVQTVEEFIAEYKSLAKKVYPGQNEDFIRFLKNKSHCNMRELICIDTKTKFLITALTLHITYAGT